MSNDIEIETSLNDRALLSGKMPGKGLKRLIDLQRILVGNDTGLRVIGMGNRIVIVTMIDITDHGKAHDLRQLDDDMKVKAHILYMEDAIDKPIAADGGPAKDFIP